jgi:hypothetical protein
VRRHYTHEVSPVDKLFIALIILVILGIVVVLIYLLDRINTIEGRAGFASGAVQAVANAVSGVDVNNGFDGFVGKKLWDAVCGKANPPLDTAALASLRERFEPILEKHITELVEEGAKDAIAGANNAPKSSRTISTLRASVESWLPPQHVSSLYKAGYEAVTNPDDLPRIGQSLDETCSTLYARCDLGLTRPFSERLLGPQAQADAAPDGTGIDTPQDGLPALENASGTDAGAADTDIDSLDDFSVAPVKRK